MRVALFVPCYVDQFYPQVAVASLEVLEKLGISVHVPPNQTCCGQPLANSGFEHLTSETNQHFRELFNDYDYVVSPSGSCILHARDHVMGSHHGEPSQAKLVELTEFLTDIIEVKSLSARFPHKVGLHESCHGQRGLKLSQMSELNAPAFSKPRALLSMVKDIELIDLTRKDECCGFGGTFSVLEEAVSVKMGKDRIRDHQIHGAEYITGTDMSCLMHLEGIIKRQGGSTKVVHIAEIINAVQ